MKTTESEVQVSDVIGTGDEARRMVRVGDWTLSVRAEPEAEPEIADEDLAARLGLPLHKFRQLSGRHESAGNIAPRVSTTVVESKKEDRHESAGNINPRRVYPAVGESKKGGRPGLQRFYGEADALFLVTRSERPEAVALTKEMIRVYMLARRGLLAPVAAPAIDPAVSDALRSIPVLARQVETLTQMVTKLTEHAKPARPARPHRALPAPKPRKSDEECVATIEKFLRNTPLRADLYQGASVPVVAAQFLWNALYPGETMLGLDKWALDRYMQKLGWIAMKISGAMSLVTRQPYAIDGYVGPHNWRTNRHAQ